MDDEPKRDKRGHIMLDDRYPKVMEGLDTLIELALEPFGAGLGFTLVIHRPCGHAVSLHGTNPRAGARALREIIPDIEAACEQAERGAPKAN